MNWFHQVKPPSEEYIIGFGEGMYYVVKDNKYKPGTEEFSEYERGWFDGHAHRNNNVEKVLDNGS